MPEETNLTRLEHIETAIDYVKQAISHIRDSGINKFTNRFYDAGTKLLYGTDTDIGLVDLHEILTRTDD